MFEFCHYIFLNLTNNIKFTIYVIKLLQNTKTREDIVKQRDRPEKEKKKVNILTLQQVFGLYASYSLPNIN